MTEFEVNGVRYRIQRIDAMKQWHLSRKVSPLIPPLVPVFLRIAKSANKSKGAIIEDIEGISELVGPFAEGISQMSDEHSEYVFNTCRGRAARRRRRQVAKGLASGIEDQPVRRAERPVETPADDYQGHLGRARPFYQRSPYRTGDRGAASSSVAWNALPGEEDWLLNPVAEGWCKYESLIDGTLALHDIALMNDAIEVRADNQKLAQKLHEK